MGVRRTPGRRYLTRLSSSRASSAMTEPAWGSAPGPRRRTCQEPVDDLHALLVYAHLPGSYVMVRHSFGGQIVRLYAHQNRAEVVGMVLYRCHCIMIRTHALALLPPASPKDSPWLVNIREILTTRFQLEQDVRYNNPYTTHTT